MGSEMCIRDSCWAAPGPTKVPHECKHDPGRQEKAKRKETHCKEEPDKCHGSDSRNGRSAPASTRRPCLEAALEKHAPCWKDTAHLLLPSKYGQVHESSLHSSPALRQTGGAASALDDRIHREEA